MKKLILKLLAVFALMLSQNATAMLINGGFETPVPTNGQLGFFTEAQVPGWSTTDPGGIEIWANGFNGVTSYEGTQHAEINAFINGTLYQDVSGIAAGSSIGYQFAHRGRAGTDVMRLTITDLGVDGLFGSVDDTTLFTNLFSADTSAWVFNSGAGLTALGNDIRFAYSAVSTATGNPSVGNFLDAANFGVGVGVPVPEPSIIALFAAGLFGLGFARRRKA